MFKYFDYFLPRTVTFDDRYSLCETKNGYEFEAYAFATSPQEAYVVITGPDLGRIDDMKDVVHEEFDAEILGWLVLLEWQSHNYGSIVAQPTPSDIKAITHYDKQMPVWIVKLKPNSRSRLLA